jgi:hypothetical protein
MILHPVLVTALGGIMWSVSLFCRSPGVKPNWTHCMVGLIIDLEAVSKLRSIPVDLRRSSVFVYKFALMA